MSALRQYFCDEGAWIGSCGRVLIAFWGPNPTVARLDRVAENQRTVAKEYPDGVVSISVIPQLGSGVPRLGAEERKRVAEIVAEIGHLNRASANVIEGSGFWSSALRAILTGVSLLGKTPSKAFAEVDDAVLWLSGLAPAALNVGEVVHAVGEARNAWLAERRARDANAKA